MGSHANICKEAPMRPTAKRSQARQGTLTRLLLSGALRRAVSPWTLLAVSGLLAAAIS
jgi:hypothetical protein